MVLFKARFQFNVFVPSCNNTSIRAGISEISYHLTISHAVILHHKISMGTCNDILKSSIVCFLFLFSISQTLYPLISFFYYLAFFETRNQTIKSLRNLWETSWVYFNPKLKYFNIHLPVRNVYIYFCYWKLYITLLITWYRRCDYIIDTLAILWWHF